MNKNPYLEPFRRYPTVSGFIQPFPSIRFIPNLSNRFSGDIQPFGSNQIQIPPFLSLSNRFVDIQPFPDLSNYFLRSDPFPIYPTTVGYPKNGWIWISRKPSLVEQNGKKKCHPGYPEGVPRVAYRFRCSSIQWYNLNLISNHFFYPTIWTKNGGIWVWINPNG